MGTVVDFAQARKRIEDRRSEYSVVLASIFLLPLLTMYSANIMFNTLYAYSAPPATHKKAKLLQF